MELHEYAHYDGLGLAELVQRREIQPAELVDLALRGIAQVNPQLNAVITLCLERGSALSEDALPDGPLRGVPFVIKDLLAHAAGIPVDSGSRFFGNIIFSTDSEIVRRFRKAGLVLVARTNTPEMGLTITTEPVLYGPTRNPWQLTKSPGGSSGGSAAIVAAGAVPIAYANDGAGSIRIPASACGLVGLKPTRGRISAGPDAGEFVFGLVYEFAVTRTVRDSAVLLDAVQGPLPGDPYVIQPPQRAYLEEVATLPGQLKIAFTTTRFDGIRCEPACVKAVEETARLLESLGHTVVEAAPQLDFAAVLAVLVAPWATLVARRVEAVRQTYGRIPSPETLEAATWALYQYGLNQVTGVDLANAFGVFNQVTRAVAKFMQRYDVLVTPTMPTPPFDLGVYNHNDPAVDAQGWTDFFDSGAHFTGLFNITGQPAMSLPLGQTESQLPIGIQFVARYGDEANLFRLASQLEQARPWRDRQPPIHIS